MPVKGGDKARKSKSSRKAPEAQHKRLGLVFPVGRLNRMMKQGRFSERIGGSSGVFMAGVLEYIASEILDLGGEICDNRKMKTIQPNHLNLAVRGDEELTKLMSKVTMTQSALLPNIHEFLLPADKKKKAAKMGPTQEM